MGLLKSIGTAWRKEMFNPCSSDSNCLKKKVVEGMTETVSLLLFSFADCEHGGEFLHFCSEDSGSGESWSSANI